MERLTYRDEKGWVGVHNIEDKTVSPTSVAIHKLAEFEDFMEEQSIKSLEQLKEIVEVYKNAKEFSFRLSARKCGRTNDLMKQAIAIYKYKICWQKLKEYITNKLEQHRKYGGTNFTLGNVLFEMQELEKGQR